MRELTQAFLIASLLILPDARAAHASNATPLTLEDLRQSAIGGFPVAILYGRSVTGTPSDAKKIAVKPVLVDSLGRLVCSVTLSSTVLDTVVKGPVNVNPASATMWGIWNPSLAFTANDRITLAGAVNSSGNTAAMHALSGVNSSGVLNPTSGVGILFVASQPKVIAGGVTTLGSQTGTPFTGTVGTVGLAAHTAQVGADGSASVVSYSVLPTGDSGGATVPIESGVRAAYVMLSPIASATALCGADNVSLLRAATANVGGLPAGSVMQPGIWYPLRTNALGAAETWYFATTERNLYLTVWKYRYP